MENVILSVYLVTLSVFDGKERRIPVSLVCGGFLAAVAVVAYKCSQKPEEWELIVLSTVLGAIPGAVMLAVAYVTGKVGYGDGLVLAEMGMLMGYGSCVLLICFSLLLMSIWCIGLLCCRKGKRNTQVPYLPFLTAVYLVGLLV